LKKGANISIGKNAPIKSLIEAFGIATSVMINQEDEPIIALPSLSFVKNGETIVIIDAPDSVVAAVEKLNGASIYGAYNNVLSTTGVSALWNGYIRQSIENISFPNTNKFVFNGATVPLVKNNGNAVVSVAPDNLILPATNVIFFDKQAKSGSVSQEDAVKRIATLSETKKEKVAESILKNVNKVSVISDASQLYEFI
jgi:hypothetical protein